MKIRYLILLAAILFVIGCQQPATTPTPTEPTPTEPTPTEPVPTEPLVVTGDVMINDRVVTPEELTVSAGTEVSISVEGKSAHILQVVKPAIGGSGPQLENLGTLKDGDVVTYVFEETGDYTIKSLKVGSVRVAVTVE